MRQNPHLFVPFACTLSLFTGELLAQDPVETPPAENQPAAEAAPQQEAPRGPGSRRQGRPRQRTVAVFAGNVHPVSAPTIQNGVVVFRGDRIVAVGKEGEVEVPENAETIRFADGHIYPGLVDASSDAFLDDGVRQDPSADAATHAGEAFGKRFDREDRIIETGITTLYASSSRGAPWSGTGAILRPKKDGASRFPERLEAGVGMQLAAGATGTHALDRQRAIEGAFAAFTGLDDYKKKQDEHKKALEKYTKDFADYLAYFEKKNGKTGDEKKPTDGEKPAAAPDAAAQPTEGGAGARGTRGGRRGAGQPQGPGGGGPGGGRRPGGEPGGEPKPEDPKPEQPKPDEPKPDQPKPDQPKPDQPKPEQPKPEQPKPQEPEKPKPQGDGKPAETKQEPKPAEQKPAEQKAGEAKPAEAKADEKPPERPKYPKAPDRDPVKDTLLKVLDGALPLRVTARRPDEMRAALAAAREKKVPSIVFDDALGAASVAKELADAAVPCVLTGLFPVALPESFEKLDPLAAPLALQDAGVPFAIATGSGRRARTLPMMAAAAVGAGLSQDAAIRAITLTAAEILGVQKDIGSLQQGKLADLVVCDRPLLQSDSRVLAVYSGGALQFEPTPAKKESR